MRRVLLPAVAALALAGPVSAAPKPGDRATVAVSVATLWKAPNVYRSIDRPAVTAPVNLDAWNRNLVTGSLRRELTSKIQTQALFGMTVFVLEVRAGWAKVAVRDEPDPQNPRGYPGWLPLSQLRTGWNEAGPGEIVVVPRAKLHLTSGRTIDVSYGTRLPHLRTEGNWAVVRTPLGDGTIARKAFVPSYVPTGASIVRQAERFMGLRYLWGGLSAWGFDCSGLVWDLYRVHGMTIPRDADPQFRHGTAVAQSALQPGDLVFYGTQKYVHHVAIYAGGGMMIESPNSDSMVRLVPFRTTEYAGARRYVTG
jgi:hypothetical protein